MARTRLTHKVISLTTSTDRRAQVSENLAEHALDWAFMDACRPGDPSDVTSDPDTQRDHFGRALTPGEVACYRSHIKVLDAFEADRTLDWLLVTEDDVWVDTGFPFAALVDALEGWGIGYLRLYARDLKPAWPRHRFGEHQILFVTTDPYGAQGYLISRAAAARFRAGAMEIRRPVDDQMSRFWENGLDLHMIHPYPIVERYLRSTLDDAREASKEAEPGPGARFQLNRVKDALAKRLYLVRRRAPFARDRIVVQKR